MMIQQNGTLMMHILMALTSLEFFHFFSNICIYIRTAEIQLPFHCALKQEQGKYCGTMEQRKNQSNPAIPFGCCQDLTSRFWVIMSLMISVSILAPSPRGLTRVLMRRACTRCQESMLGVMF